MARKLGVVALVLLFLLLVIPLGITMVMAPCPECEAGLLMSSGTVCLVILLAMGVLAAPGMARPFLLGSNWRRPLLLARDLDPPPRFI